MGSGRGEEGLFPKGELAGKHFFLRMATPYSRPLTPRDRCVWGRKREYAYGTQGTVRVKARPFESAVASMMREFVFLFTVRTMPETVFDGSSIPSNLSSFAVIVHASA